MSEVCQLLEVNTGKVRDYLQIDLSFLLNITGVPDGWVPMIGPWDWPVPGVFSISSGFGTRPDPFTGKIRKHDGIDIPGDTGTAVKSASAGIVISRGWAGGYGNLVVVDHGDGIKTYYGHLSVFSCSKGQVVEKGQELGKMGSTGRSTGPHLHFEVRVNGVPVNPVSFYDS